MSSYCWRCEILIPQYDLSISNQSLDPVTPLDNVLMYLFDDTPPLPQIGSSTRSLPRYTRFRFRSGEPSPHRIKVYRGHIEGIHNCEMSFDIYLSWVGSLRIVIRLLM